jgi:nitronate monooxygenase
LGAFGRGVINQNYRDASRGVDWDENIKLYKEAETEGDQGWGSQARLTTFAGTGVGLVTKKLPAGKITEEIREDARRILMTTTVCIS